ncbi:MAG: hypothetical protein DDT33_01718 [Firmicutes bacterium]|nr:hypothetical protein [Bacillota bacterium]
MGLAMNIRSGGMLKDPELEKFLKAALGKEGLAVAGDLEEIIASVLRFNSPP